MGEASVLSHCTLLRNPSPIPTGVLEHCRQGEVKLLFLHFFGAFPSSVHFFYSWFYRNFSSAANSVNYVGEFLEIFEATTHFSVMTVMNAV
jgi:hypothetical protein